MADSPDAPPPPSLRAVNPFSLVWWSTVVLGYGVVLVSAVLLLGETAVAEPAALIVLTALVVFGELRPVVTSRSYGEGVTPSIAFTFAIAFLWGPLPALLAQAIGSVVADVAVRKAWWRVVFNPAQYAVSLVLAWGAMALAGYSAQPGQLADPVAADLAPMAVGWVVYFLANNLVVSGLVSCYTGDRFPTLFFEDFRYLIASNFSVFVISPLVALAVRTSLVWVLLLLPPLVAIYRTSAMSLDKEHQANHDPLTGLPNRKYLVDHLNRTLAEADGRLVALFLLDLDRFKEVNDTLGHQTGDRLLQHVAARIHSALRPDDLVARLGGDEFAVVLPNVPDPDAAEEVARRILAAVAEPFSFEGVLLEPEASIGIAFAPDHGADVQALQRSADVAMYLAKEERSGVEMYAVARDRHSTGRLGLLGALRLGIDTDELELHYQPKLALSSGAVVGVEALVRWRHPTRGLILPDEFVPLAEHSGLMHRLTAFVIDEALAQAQRWWSVGLQVPVAVNVSARDLHGPLLARAVARGLTRHELPATALRLELTERVLMAEPGRVADSLSTLERLGVRLSLDDFGTGYSSMVLLKRLPVSEIKVDRSFVVRAGQSADDAAIVKSLVDLAHALGIVAVAEGVETEEVWDLLGELGCDQAQGWFISPPMPAERATEYLLRHPSRRPALQLLRADTPPSFRVSEG